MNNLFRTSASAPVQGRPHGPAHAPTVSLVVGAGLLLVALLMAATGSGAQVRPAEQTPPASTSSPAPPAVVSRPPPAG